MTPENFITTTSDLNDLSTALLAVAILAILVSMDLGFASAGLVWHWGRTLLRPIEAAGLPHAHIWQWVEEVRQDRVWSWLAGTLGRWALRWSGSTLWLVLVLTGLGFTDAAI